MRRLFLPPVGVLVGSLATPAGLVAQSNVGQLHGKVTDASGAALPETDVEIRRAAGGERRTVGSRRIAVQYRGLRPDRRQPMDRRGTQALVDLFDRRRLRALRPHAPFPSSAWRA